MIVLLIADTSDTYCTYTVLYDNIYNDYDILKNTHKHRTVFSFWKREVQFLTDQSEHLVNLMMT